jgi:dienelactone hydrolase
MGIDKHEFLSSGCRCEAWLFRPAEWRRPIYLPTIVIVPGGHGLLSSGGKGDCGHGLEELARAFTRDGFLVVAYNGRGQGNSEGSRTGHEQYVQDLQVALAWMREQVDGVDPERIGLLGQSVGGMAAVVAATREKGIRSLILWGTLPRYSIAKDNRIKRVLEDAWEKSGKEKALDEFVRDYDIINPIDYVSRLSQPILFAGGLKDSVFFVRDEQIDFLMAATNSPVTMRLEVSGETHRMHHAAPHFSAVARVFSAWFLDSL